MTYVEKILLDHISKWLDDMSNYTDKQYGIAEMKIVYREAIDQINGR